MLNSMLNKKSQVGSSSAAAWLSFWCSTRLSATQALIKTKTLRRGNVPPAILLLSCKLLLKSIIAGGTFLFLNVLVLISACVCRRPSYDSCRLISVSATAGKRVVASPGGRVEYKNSTKRILFGCVIEFSVFNSSKQKKSDQAR